MVAALYFIKTRSRLFTILSSFVRWLWMLVTLFLCNLISEFHGHQVNLREMTKKHNMLAHSMAIQYENMVQPSSAHWGKQMNLIDVVLDLWPPLLPLASKIFYDALKSLQKLHVYETRGFIKTHVFFLSDLFSFVFLSFWWS